MKKLKKPAKLTFTRDVLRALSSRATASVAAGLPYPESQLGCNSVLMQCGSIDICNNSIWICGSNVKTCYCDP
jgi:hypothetical protein